MESLPTVQILSVRPRQPHVYILTEERAGTQCDAKDIRRIPARCVLNANLTVLRSSVFLA